MKLLATAWRGHEVAVDGGANDWLRVRVVDVEHGCSGIVVSPIHVEMTEEEWAELREAGDQPNSAIQRSLLHRWTFDPLHRRLMPNPDWG